MSLEIFDNPGRTPLQFIESYPGNIKLYIKREDLIHPLVSGNKWRKLKYNMIEAHKMGFLNVLTFGGAFSNHIYATAAAGAACGINTIGVIRGEILEPLNSTLSQAVDWGMQLVAVSREEYRNKSAPDFLAKLKSRFGKFYLIPEGGSNTLALKGCAEIAAISQKFDYWCVSCGTGGTLAGLLSGLSRKEKVIGFSALKGGTFLEKDIRALLTNAKVKTHIQWELNHEYHFGGYAKITRELLGFINEFKDRYKILLDPIYTGKMMFGVIDLINNGCFPADSNILAIHTGGLQGITGIEEKYGKKIK